MKTNRGVKMCPVPLNPVLHLLEWPQCSGSGQCYFWKQLLLPASWGALGKQENSRLPTPTHPQPAGEVRQRGPALGAPSIPR